MPTEFHADIKRENTVCIMYQRKRKYKRSFSRKRSKRVRRNGKRSLTNKIKAVALKQVETKTVGGCYSFICNTENTVFPGSTVGFNALGLNDITIHSDSNEQWNTRYGKQYIYLGTQLKFAFGQTENATLADVTNPTIALQRAIMVRILVVSNKRNMRGTATPLATDAIWLDQQNTNVAFEPTANGTLNVLSYRLDPKLYTVHHDKVVSLGGGGNGFGSKMVNMWLKPPKNGKKINCNDDLAGDGGQDVRYWVFWVAYDPAAPGAGIEPAPAEDVKYYKAAVCFKTYFKDP